MQHRICAVSGDKLLDCLERIENAGAGGRGQGQAFAVGDDRVALRLHLVGHLGCRVALRQGVGIDGVRERSSVARDQDVDGGGGADLDALRCQPGLEVVDGEGVLRRAWGGAIDLDSAGQRLYHARGYLAGNRDQLQRHSPGRLGVAVWASAGCEERNQEDRSQARSEVTHDLTVNQRECAGPTGFSWSRNPSGSSALVNARSILRISVLAAGNLPLYSQTLDRIQTKNEQRSCAAWAFEIGRAHV